MRKIYPFAFITHLKEAGSKLHIEKSKEIVYRAEKSKYIDEYQYKYVLDFTDNPKIKRFYKKRSAFNVLQLKDFMKNSKKKDLSLIESTLCRR